MNLFEYQGKRLFSEYGIPVPQGILITELGQIPHLPRGGVIKPQILTGGRGKAGAIRFVDSEEQATVLAEHFLNVPVKGHQAEKILIEEKVDIAKEYYFSIFVNRPNKCISLMFSPAGGVEIEGNDSKEISIVEVNPLIGLQDYMVKTLLSRFALNNKEFDALIKKAYSLFTEKKMMLLEINPLVTTGSGKLMALDAKVVLDDWVVDDNIREENKQSSNSMTPFERLFAEAGANAVELDGNIAILAGGAGASMATADSIVRRGGKVRCIIDRGTIQANSADETIRKQVAEVEQMILTLNPKVIFINLYFQAGRMDYECATLKLAFEKAAQTVPVVARCVGRMANEGRQLLMPTPIRVITSYEEACAEVIRLEAM
jgi:succinyl-CoA synthetase beta subunit